RRDGLRSSAPRYAWGLSFQKLSFSRLEDAAVRQSVGEARGTSDPALHDGPTDRRRGAGRPSGHGGTQLPPSKPGGWGQVHADNRLFANACKLGLRRLCSKSAKYRASEKKGPVREQKAAYGRRRSPEVLAEMSAGTRLKRLKLTGRWP